jgi:hypothetical protein
MPGTGRSGGDPGRGQESQDFRGTAGRNTVTGASLRSLRGTPLVPLAKRIVFGKRRLQRTDSATPYTHR